MTILISMEIKFGPPTSVSAVVAIQNLFAPAGNWVPIVRELSLIFRMTLFRRGILGDAIHLGAR